MADASYPDDLRYHEQHDWARVEGDTATFGITWYAQDALGEVVFFEPPDVGTEVAKEASKIVLLDDAFSTIVHAVHWGRSLYENIQRFIQFQLTINVSALVIAFLGPFFGVKPPFTILQLLWINVIMDTLASIALCSEPPRPGTRSLPVISSKSGPSAAFNRAAAKSALRS